MESSTWSCGCDKGCETDEHLKVFRSIKCHVDNLVITNDEIIDTPDVASISSFDKNVMDKSSYWLPLTLLLANISLMLFIVIAIIF